MIKPLKVDSYTGYTLLSCIITIVSETSAHALTGIIDTNGVYCVYDANRLQNKYICDWRDLKNLIPYLPNISTIYKSNFVNAYFEYVIYSNDKYMKNLRPTCLLKSKPVASKELQNLINKRYTTNYLYNLFTKNKITATNYFKIINNINSKTSTYRPPKRQRQNTLLTLKRLFEENAITRKNYVSVYYKL